MTDPMNVLVLGTPYSGTSAVTGALLAAGLSGGMRENPARFVERPDIRVFNDRLLASLGWTWDAPDAVPHRTPPPLPEFIEEGRRLVNEKLAGPGPWVATDPRIAVLLPWWRQILLDRFVAVVPLRAAADIAGSLHVRDGFEPELGLSLWAAYHRHLASGLEGLPVIGVDYAAIGEAPAKLIRQLLSAMKRLGVSTHFDFAAASAALRSVLTRPTQPAARVPKGAIPRSVMAIEKLWSADRGGLWVQERLALKVPPPNSWETALLGRQRRARQEEREKARLVSEVEAQRLLVVALESERGELRRAVDLLRAEGATMRAQADNQRSRMGALEDERNKLQAVAASLDADNEQLLFAAEAQRVSDNLRRAEAESLRAEVEALRAETGQLRSLAAELEAKLQSAPAHEDFRGAFRGPRISPRRALHAVHKLAARGLVKILPPALLAHVWHNPLFDGRWYLDVHGDVREKRMHAERHYRRHGAKEGRNPNPLFDTNWYLYRYSDVAASGMNPLDHYYFFGAQEGRDPSLGFDSDWYLANNPDVRWSGFNPLLHYLRHGAREGRAPHPDTAEDEPAYREEEIGFDTRPADHETVRLLLVVHDAHNHGAQQNALHMARSLSERFHVVPDIVLLGEGVLWPEFEHHGRVHDFARQLVNPEDRVHRLRQLRSEGVDVAICNTTVSGRLAPLLKAEGYHVVTLIHELPQLIREYGLESTAKDVVQYSDTVVFASDFVRRAFESIGGDLGSRAVVRPQGLYRAANLGEDRDSIRASVRSDLGLEASCYIVLAAGYADKRKGFDLFVDVFSSVRAARSDVAFVWLGCEDRALSEQAIREAKRLGFEQSLRLLPRVPDVTRYYAAADILLLPSREDPFPSVVLEAMSHGVPTVAFANATGMGDLLERGCGVLVPNLDTAAMSKDVLQLLDDPELRHAMGLTGSRIVTDEFDWLDYMYFLLGVAGYHLRRVSVIVPNYNYARYLPRRLESVFQQTYPLREVIVIDDASSDDSLDVLAVLHHERQWDFATVHSATNSGSVVRQWLRGVSQARGELVWIAEADDFADPQFLARLVPAFANDRTVIAYCESRQVDEAGNLIAGDYLNYVGDIDAAKWTQSWTRPGLDELAESFSVRNTIPNVSAVLFDRSKLQAAIELNIDLVTSLRVAGDYAVYVHMLLTGGNIAFVADALNNHRRHMQSVTTASYGQLVVSEIARIQRLVHERLPVHPETRDHASQYLLQLCAQFDLGPDFAATFGVEHRTPALSDS